MFFMRHLFSSLTHTERRLWWISLIIVTLSNLATGDVKMLSLFATLIGVTALIFLAKGDVFGQILTIVFSLLYAATAFTFHYYGEIITYLGMTAPIAALSVWSWLRNPYQKSQGRPEVKIHRMSARETLFMWALTLAITAVAYFLLKALTTPHLSVSTLSIATSFLASYLMLRRNSGYALAYAANDLVLMTLWILATLENITYLPMIACFVMFLVNDLYGYVRWKKREQQQKQVLPPAVP